MGSPESRFGCQLLENESYVFMFHAKKLRREMVQRFHIYSEEIFRYYYIVTPVIYSPLYVNVFHTNRNTIRSGLDLKLTWYNAIFILWNECHLTRLTKIMDYLFLCFTEYFCAAIFLLNHNGNVMNMLLVTKLITQMPSSILLIS